MSDTIETPTAAAQTPAEVAAAKAQRIADKAMEFTGLVGKTFARKVPNLNLPNQTFVVKSYIGILQHQDGLKWHTISVHSQNPADVSFTPAAKKFLDEFVEVKAKPETETADEIK